MGRGSARATAKEEATPNVCARRGDLILATHNAEGILPATSLLAYNRRERGRLPPSVGHPHCPAWILRGGLYVYRGCCLQCGRWTFAVFPLVAAALYHNVVPPLFARLAPGFTGDAVLTLLSWMDVLPLPRHHYHYPTMPLTPNVRWRDRRSFVTASTW